MLDNSLKFAWMNGFTTVAQFQWSSGKTKTYYIVLPRSSLGIPLKWYSMQDQLCRYKIGLLRSLALSYQKSMITTVAKRIGLPHDNRLNRSIRGQPFIILGGGTWWGLKKNNNDNDNSQGLQEILCQLGLRKRIDSVNLFNTRHPPLMINGRPLRAWVIVWLAFF